MPILLRTRTLRRLCSFAHAWPARVRASASVPALRFDEPVDDAEAGALDVFQGPPQAADLSTFILRLKDALQLARSHVAVAPHSLGLSDGDMPPGWGNWVPPDHRGPRATQKQRLRAFELHEGLCAACKDALDMLSFHVDHRIPLAVSGSSEQENLQPLHPECHKVKTKTERPYIDQARKIGMSHTRQLEEVLAALLAAPPSSPHSVEVISSDKQLGRPRSVVAAEKKKAKAAQKQAYQAARAVLSFFFLAARRA